MEKETISIAQESSDCMQIKQTLVEIKQKFLPNETKWLNINDLCHYHPDKPSKNTVYSWVSKRKIPFHKPPGSKKLRFLRVEIDAWILSGASQPTEHDPTELISLLKKTKSN